VSFSWVALTLGQGCERPAGDAQATLAGMDLSAEQLPRGGSGALTLEHGAPHGFTCTRVNTSAQMTLRMSLVAQSGPPLAWVCVPAHSSV